MEIMMTFCRKSILKKAILFLAFFLFGQTSLLWARKAILKDIVVTTSAKELFVYFTVANSFTKDMEEAILNGVPVTFTYKLVLEEKRSFFPNKTIASFSISHTMKYDQLKGVFIITKEGKKRERLTSKDLIWAKKLMTEVETPIVPLNKLKKGHRYELRLKAELSKVKLPLFLHYVLFFSSLWNFETDWYTVEFVY